MRLSFATKLILLSTLFILPLWVSLLFKWPNYSDLLFYTVALNGFSDQLWQGDWYPRWLMSSNDGLGAPVFVFYSPLAFYVMSVFEWLRDVDPYGFGRIAIGIQLGMLAMGFSCRRWLLSYMNKEKAELGALIYVSLPYVLILIYFRFALAQFLMMALYPLLLKAADDMVKRKPGSLPVLAIGYGLLFLTHLPSALVFTSVPLIYVFIVSHQDRQQNAWKVFAAACWGIAMASFYLIPAYYNMPFVETAEFITRKFHFATNFYHLQTAFGIVLLIMPLAGMYLELPKAIRTQLMTPEIRFCLTVVVAGSFFMMPISIFFWEMLIPMQYLQFPFRFLVPMLPCIALVALLWRPHVRSKNIYAGLTACTLMFCAIYTYEDVFDTDPEAKFYNMETLFEANSIGVREVVVSQRIVVPEYQTKWMSGTNINAMTLPEELRNMPQVVLSEGAGTISLESWGAGRIVIDADIRSPEAIVTLRHFYFPLWETSVGTIIEKDALLAVNIPSGSHRIEMTFGWLDGEQLGLTISAAALLLWLAAYAASRKRIWAHG